MAWNAKPSGGYAITTDEALENIGEAWEMMADRDYTTEAGAGVLGNVQAESGFNPWRWQGDSYGTSRGYGLFQFTPASGYLNLDGVTPNLSTTEVTTGADPSDGARQMDCFMDNELSKWVGSAWRSYWSVTEYAELYRKRGVWLKRWGNGSSISMAQFSQCKDLEAATFFMLACFEGPAVPNYTARYNNAKVIQPLLGKKSLPVWLLFAMKNNLDKII